MNRESLRFDFNNMFDEAIGRYGVSGKQYNNALPRLEKAIFHLNTLISNKDNRLSLGLEWTRLPYQEPSFISSVQRMGDEIAKKYDNVLSLGIGGSYLGLKAAQDALAAPYYNEFISSRKERPRVFFEGNNLDPETLSSLLKNLDPRRTFVIVISKSGETTETRAAFGVVEAWLKHGAGKRYGRQIAAITDPASGHLRNRVSAEQASDHQSFCSLDVLKGVGGRYSELNVGLLHMAVCGIPIQQVLDGAAAMAKRCSIGDARRNPAAMYAALHTILYRKKGIDISVLMPFGEGLKSTADWYVQLLAESLGKKYGRKIICDGNTESWVADKNRVLHFGRTPVSARGTNDLHSIQQNNVEGRKNKVLTFIKIKSFKNDIKIPDGCGVLSGKKYGNLLWIAAEATEWALAKEGRPNCSVIMPRVSPRHWGELIFFFEMATAIEGELLSVNAFDQPGVETYKNYMYYKLKKTGLAKKMCESIRRSPLKKSSRYIL